MNNRSLQVMFLGTGNRIGASKLMHDRKQNSIVVLLALNSERHSIDRVNGIISAEKSTMGRTTLEFCFLSCKGPMQQIQFDAAWHIPCSRDKVVFLPMANEFRYQEIPNSKFSRRNFVNPEFLTKFANNIK